MRWVTSTMKHVNVIKYSVFGVKMFGLLIRGSVNVAVFVSVVERRHMSRDAKYATQKHVRRDVLVVLNLPH